MCEDLCPRGGFQGRIGLCQTWQIYLLRQILRAQGNRGDVFTKIHSLSMRNRYIILLKLLFFLNEHLNNYHFPGVDPEKLAAKGYEPVLADIRKLMGYNNLEIKFLNNIEKQIKNG